MSVWLTKLQPLQGSQPRSLLSQAWPVESMLPVLFAMYIPISWYLKDNRLSVFITALWARFCHHLHFIEREAEVWMGQLTHPRSTGWDTDRTQNHVVWAGLCALIDTVFSSWYCGLGDSLVFPVSKGLPFILSFNSSNNNNKSKKIIYPICRYET